MKWSLVNLEERFVMACEHPRPAWFRNDRVGRALLREPIGGDQADYYRGVLPCNECVQCRARHAREWSIRVMHEASLHSDNCMITLTYDREHLPFDRGLHKRDFQLFMKRLRFEIFPWKVRFLGVGEYGSKYGRPHYHACLLGFNFPDLVLSGPSSTSHDCFNSQMLTRIWGQGICAVSELTSGSAAYCAQYCLKKADGELEPGKRRWRRDANGLWCQVEPEFLLCSRRPGLGRRWLEKFSRDVYRDDRGVVVFAGGAEVMAPAAYDRWFEAQDPEGFLRMKAERQRVAWSQAKDSTPARLAVRAEVAAAKRRERSAF